MKIIQSYWSFPDQSNTNQRQHVKSDINKEIFMTLSCLKLREFYDDVELYTDAAGKSLLIDELGLPYTKVHVCLDQLTKKYSPYKNLWALGKIYAYKQQTEPFLHVDNDVFIWNRFPDNIMNSSLIAQSYELNNGHHKFNLYSIKPCLGYIPEVIKNNIKDKHDGGQYNAGIIGGKNVSFFQDFSNEAFTFIDKNLHRLNNLPNKTCFPCLFEQYLFSVMAMKAKMNVTTLFPKPNTPMDNFKDLVEIHDRYRTNYIHLVGDHKKEYHNTCLISEILWAEYPSYHEKIMNKYGCIKN